MVCTRGPGYPAPQQPCCNYRTTMHVPNQEENALLPSSHQAASRTPTGCSHSCEPCMVGVSSPLAQRFANHSGRCFAGSTVPHDCLGGIFTCRRLSSSDREAGGLIGVAVSSLGWREKTCGSSCGACAAIAVHDGSEPRTNVRLIEAIRGRHGFQYPEASAAD